MRYTHYTRKLKNSICFGNGSKASGFLCFICLHKYCSFILCFLFCCFLITPVFAESAQDIYAFTTKAQETQFNALTQELRCLVCQNQTLSDSNAPLAKDLRAQVFQMVKENKSDEEIKQYLVSRYGDFVLYTPPFMPLTYLLWFMPGIILVIGFLLVRRLSK
jgi:cytochrome c-type biogenesis protein CcmH